MTPHAVDPLDVAQLDSLGYVVRPMLRPADIDALWALFESLPVAYGTGFTATLAQLDHAENLRVSAAIEAVVLPRLDGLVEGFRPIGSTFLVKGSGEEGAMVVHQDWNSVDERVAQSVNIWCPLSDVGLEDGPLEVVPGSHRWFSSFRSPLLPSVQVPFETEIESVLQPLPVPAGTAIVYSHALLHGSRENRSGRPRVVVQMGMAPVDQPLAMCFPGAASTVELRQVDASAFFRGFEFEAEAPGTFPGDVLAVLPEAPLGEGDVLEQVVRRSIEPPTVPPPGRSLRRRLLDAGRAGVRRASLRAGR